MDYGSWQAADADSGSSRLSVGAEDEDAVPLEDLPACQSCRKRKSKCSREMPSCSQCIRLRCECVYLTKQKPGLKAGAVEGLGRRLQALEALLLDHAGNRKPQLAFLDVDSEQSRSHPLPSLFSPSNASRQNDQDPSSETQGEGQVGAPSRPEGPQKRRRVDEADRWPEVDSDLWLPPLPSLPLLEAVVEAHFRTVHHWMPILHETRFRAKLKDYRERERLAVLFHALVSTSIKYVHLEDFDMSLEDAERQIRVSRRSVIMNAMESLSLENAQALVFLAFDYTGSGEVTKSWPIIGSLTRTANYLQLTIEPDHDSSQKQPLLRSLSILDKPQDWTDSEGRRRLFWVIFLLDRICSVTSGWHTSLTADDVHRRLPCSGGLWAREEPVLTPFFGIWDNSTAKIGNSIANDPNLYSPTRPHDQPSPPSTSDVDTSKLGAFAHCIEATENLSQVTAFFLQQGVNFEDLREVKNWLTRFKELDLRLVHWKMFLPQQWQDSNISRDVTVIKMDPNLTLAHITHNTSMILLHQHIAYPPASWKDVVKLPSSCSAETCQLAAVETASIVEKYLRHMGGIVNSQFSFCAFIAARVLLVRWRSDARNSLAPAFFSLLKSLQNISTRWLGTFALGGRSVSEPARQERLQGEQQDLAARYASQLRDLHSLCMSDSAPPALAEILQNASLEGFLAKQITPAVPQHRSSYSNNSGGSVNSSIQGHSPASHASPRGHQPRPPIVATNLDLHHHATQPDITPISRSQAHSHPPTEYNRQGSRRLEEDAIARLQYSSLRWPIVAPHTSNMNEISSTPSPMPPNIDQPLNQTQSTITEEDEWIAMSQMLLENQFLEMDRVIRLNGTDFYDNAGGGMSLMP